jgi:hypothetical protein
MQLEKSSKMSPEIASRLEKHGLESPESQNQRRQDIIKRNSLIKLTITEENTQRNSTTSQSPC